MPAAKPVTEADGELIQAIRDWYSKRHDFITARAYGSSHASDAFQGFEAPWRAERRLDRSEPGGRGGLVIGRGHGFLVGIGCFFFILDLYLVHLETAGDPSEQPREICFALAQQLEARRQLLELGADRFPLAPIEPIPAAGTSFEPAATSMRSDQTPSGP